MTTPTPWEKPGEWNYCPECGGALQLIEGHQACIFGHGHADRNAALREVAEVARSLRSAYVRLLECARDRVIAMGGGCDSVEVMEKNDPELNATVVALSRLAEVEK